ncbi:MAG: DUF106 domain-containing protein [Nitrososphaerota archaeon]|jgi:uncharacterized membrane protein (DUF106 family)|nr:DUF106 domain-containing protein [Nitrososphaerota archaeon]MDG7038508.1 DUF106 domain-containing protein [Nitrososphaerota archaeon]MDG7040776.1 DUF106 domain-containing protein [Nitrososphaerota archaeon]MDG7041901.1 DUF106 domain-containing protein [Nitrososphaerota archaeon]MDG7046554.1 DUF106 domain-containing protein [Nitrososphaerota archaeon]
MILQVMPFSTLFIVAITIAMAFVSNITIKKTVDIKHSNEVMKTYNEFLKEYRAVTSSGDKEKIEKMQKKQKQIQDSMMKVQWDRMKVSFYFLIPFLIIFYALSYFFGNATVALSPLYFSIFYFKATVPVGPLYGMNFITWYILVSFFTNLLLSKLMGTMP